MRGVFEMGKEPTRKRRYGVNIWHAEHLLREPHCCQTDLGRGEWVMARPLGWTSILWRLRMAWLVFRMRADVLVWKEQP
jgi:hypothetical protein